MMAFGNYYTVKDTATRLNRSVTTIYDRVKRGLFPAITIPYQTDYHDTLILIPKAHVEFVRENPAGLSPKLKVIVRHVKKGGDQSWQ